MGVIAWIVLGLIAGVIAKMVMPGKDPGGLIVTIAIGIAGAFVGGFLWNWYSGDQGYGELSFGGILIAIAGAMILLFACRKVVPRFIETRPESRRRYGSALPPRHALCVSLRM